MQLNILTPEKTLFCGEVDSVSLPGTVGMFTVLQNHAPLMSSLRKEGVITYSQGEHKHSVTIARGFVEVADNVITVCAEVAAGQDAPATE